ncbi:nuclear transport factor 2 family protein [uncultured Sphingosinicella sp.]|jgi:ketosteroid isomerase-like protein|uniref:nuclear transport factor 2 family protein n=1 Tax=uncultured Sphingosinicella sp. TaxID=478748 RepID=UPI0030DAA87C|tara:strand:- start:64552 stop:64911 length:360 start_codon:yes stop_codon:yes gene_type:complete
MGGSDWTDFAAKWCADWNARDVERVLAHFHDDAVFTSPLAAQRVPESGGTVRGKAALRAYWTGGVRAVPDLHFTIEGVFGGVDMVTILYRNQAGIRVTETLRFDGAKVREGHAAYEAAV